MSARHLIAFEGLDQSGKQTQAERLVAALRAHGRDVHFLSFPDYATPIGAEIGRALHGTSDHAPDVMQLLYVANRYEFRPQIEAWLAQDCVVVCDRYLASSVAYGEAQGLDAGWLMALQKYLPQPSLTLLLDIPPEASLQRKQRARDRYERDLALLARVRDSYIRQSAAPHWLRVDGAQDKTDRGRSRAQRRPVATRAAVSATYLARARGQQHLGARLECGAGRRHVVHENDDAVANRWGRSWSEGGERSNRRRASRRKRVPDIHAADPPQATPLAAG